MISGANEEQLELSNARANIVMKLDNTSTYESWLIIDTYIEKLEKENQELKKQLEKKYSKIGTLTNEVLYEENIKLINQQKKFIKYIEEEISKWHYNYDSYTYEYEIEEPTAEELLEDALSKFKELIGGKDER